MRKLTFILVLALFLLAQQPALAAPVGQVQNFGPDLSTTCNLPEGIAADDEGRIYASSANLSATTGPANICVLDGRGRIVDIISVAPVTGGVANLLGMLFVPGEGLYVTDIGGGRVLRIDVRTHAVTRVITGVEVPNALARDSSGNLWVSESFRGSITRIAPNGTTMRFTYSQLHPGSGFPPFGANGLAFDRGERYLYVAVTAHDQIYRIAYDGGSLGAISLFKQGSDGAALDGADGIAFDVEGNLYVCSNQSNEIAVLSPAGNVIAEYRGTGANAFNTP